VHSCFGSFAALRFPRKQPIRGRTWRTEAHYYYHCYNARHQ
jgi:hypothetical protein